MKAIFNISIFTIILSAALALAVSCSLSASPDDGSAVESVKVERYDSLQYLFLGAGDYSALQQMKTKYPVETRTLIENVLRLGSANSGDASERLLTYFHDKTLQRLIQDAENRYSNMSDINTQLTQSFQRLQKKFPHITIPEIYSQIGAFNESIVVGNDNSIGICLDKYMGEDYPLYQKFYTPDQRRTMTRSYIVPDCIGYYLISLYQHPGFETTTQQQRDEHIACIQWVVNYAIDSSFFTSEMISKVNKYMKSHPKVSFHQLLKEGMSDEGMK